MSETGWKALLAIIIFLIILIVVGLNTSYVEFDPDEQEFVPKESPQWGRIP